MKKSKLIKNKKMGISKDQKSRWEKKTEKQMGISSRIKKKQID